MFIVLESIDGGGKGRQREELCAKLENRFMETKLKTAGFPIHNAFYENVIHPALQEEVKMNRASWVLSYLLDKTLHTDEIKPFLRSVDSLFIADGYLTTTIAYQAHLMKQISVEKLLQYAEDFEIPAPDLTVYIDVDPEIAMQRKHKEEGHEEGLDMFEKSIEKQKRLREIFRSMVKEQTYGKWVMVDGNASIEEVTNAIIQQLLDNKVIK